MNAPRRDEEKMWFVPHRYGYGAFPSTCEGWALILTLVIAMSVIPWIGGNFFVAGGTYVFDIGASIIAIVLVALIARAKTKGGWRWRWGDDD